MQIKYFRLAKEAAYKSTHRVQIGSVLVNKGQVINVGWNKVGQTHPRYPWYLHSELDACLGIHRYDLSGASLYVFRSNRIGTILNCRPCVTCCDIVKGLGIKHIYFTSGQNILLGDIFPIYDEVKL